MSLAHAIFVRASERKRKKSAKLANILAFVFGLHSRSRWGQTRRCRLKLFSVDRERRLASELLRGGN